MCKAHRVEVPVQDIHRSQNHNMVSTLRHSYVSYACTNLLGRAIPEAVFQGDEELGLYDSYMAHPEPCTEDSSLLSALCHVHVSYGQCVQ